MANANTIQQLNNLPLQTLTTTTKTAFASSTSSTTRALLAMLPDVALGLFDGRPFAIHAMLRLTASVNSTYTFSIYSNSGDNTNLTTTTDDTELFTFATASGAVASTNATAFFEGILLWDSVSQSLSGITTANSIINIEGSDGTYISDTSGTAAGNVGSLVSPASAGFQFYAMSTWATAGTNTAELVEFSLNQI